MKVWCAFYISDETLEWELDAIFQSEDAANDYVKEQEDFEYLEYKAEEWEVR